MLEGYRLQVESQDKSEGLRTWQVVKYGNRSLVRLGCGDGRTSCTETKSKSKIETKNIPAVRWKKVLRWWDKGVENHELGWRKRKKKKKRI